MRAGGVCDVNSLTGLIPPVRPNDQTLADLEDSQAPFMRVWRILVHGEMRYCRYIVLQ